MKLELTSHNTVNVSLRYKLYKIAQTEFYINSKFFKIDKSTSNLVRYCNKSNINFLDLLCSDIDISCMQCNEKTEVTFTRNRLKVFDFCNKNCQHKHKINNDTRKCTVCEKLYIYANKEHKKGGTCCTQCYLKFREKINIEIKRTHWCKTDKNVEIHARKIDTRKKNDILFDRSYIPWNKGKTGIYSKETIEKIRAAAIRDRSI